jgi:2C-methyl-D-erythritol 2,4-cyclodiphosphate synthase
VYTCISSFVYDLLGIAIRLVINLKCCQQAISITELKSYYITDVSNSLDIPHGYMIKHTNTIQSPVAIIIELNISEITAKLESNAAKICQLGEDETISKLF